MTALAMLWLMACPNPSALDESVNDYALSITDEVIFTMELNQ